MTGRPGLRSLRRLATSKPPAGPPPESAAEPERCEMCQAPVGPTHGHVADTRDHRLLCVCRPCYLLFAPEGAGGARYRGVGDTVTRIDGLRLTEAQWDGLQIPVGLAFFLRQDGRFSAFYPGPSGATESLLDLAEWAVVLEENPGLAAVDDDVEAVLLRRTGTDVGCYVVPVDVCYELVGLVRTHWVGLGGGAEAWRRIEEFFDGLDARVRPAHRAGSEGR